ncbi:hypothetical protein F511_39954 [Dorcoceras hygrometricum]|uniref:Uncharacterized protein n=1 Tax=Dorcoceras hygrometricum TaxID=472368 RepID=A0A2Z7DBZ5_9LAMI|nr:hypothetical protein F511_39954 [Dorcoceras hygrometricum]
MSSIDEYLIEETAKLIGSPSSLRGEGEDSSDVRTSHRSKLTQIALNEASLMAAGRPCYLVSNCPDAEDLQEPARQWGQEAPELACSGEKKKEKGKAPWSKVASSSKRSLDDTLYHHERLMRELEEVLWAFDAERQSILSELEATRLQFNETIVVQIQEEI